MAISFAREYKRFRRELAKKHLMYEQLGMSQEQIEALDQFDREEFLSNNTYRRYTQPLIVDADSENPEDLHPLLAKFRDMLSVNLEVTFRDEYAWLDEISSPALLEKLLSLSKEDLRILDAHVFGGKTYKKIGRETTGNPQTPQSIYKKMQRIRRYLSGK